MSDPEHMKAQRLRAEGLTFAEVAAELGVSATTIQRWTKPDFAERDRAAALAWKDRNREANRARDRAAMYRPCPHCPGLRDRQSAMCAECVAAVNTARRSLVEGMWAEGWSVKEITVAVGWTSPTWSGVMRAAGWDLPGRRTVSRVAA